MVRGRIIKRPRFDALTDRVLILKLVHCSLTRPERPANNIMISYINIYGRDVRKKADQQRFRCSRWVSSDLLLMRIQHSIGSSVGHARTDLHVVRYVYRSHPFKPRTYTGPIASFKRQKSRVTRTALSPHSSQLTARACVYTLYEVYRYQVGIQVVRGSSVRYTYHTASRILRLLSLPNLSGKRTTGQMCAQYLLAKMSLDQILKLILDLIASSCNNVVVP